LDHLKVKNNMPRIAIFLATSGHSGVDRVARNLVPAFAARGIAVDLLQVRDHGPYYDDLPEGVRRIDLGTSHVYPALPSVTRYLRETRPDVLFSDKDRVNRTSILAQWLARSPARLALRSGTTISVDLASRGWLDRVSQRLSMRYLYRHAYVVLTPSEGAAEDLRQFAGLPSGKVRAVPSPIVTAQLANMAQEPPGHPWLEPGQPPVILGVGELSGRKDFATLIRAFARVRAIRSCRLVLLGEGRRRKRLLELAAALGVADDVDLPGFQANPYAFMARSAAFALSSRWEGMPVVLIEALAIGTPVASTDCPSGPREILRGGRYGPLIPVGDDETLAGALEQLLDAPPPRSLLQEAAAPYSVEASATAYLQAMGLDPAESE
jgi:glycosyltransferase involved in cell wall biosynthesis